MIARGVAGRALAALALVLGAAAAAGAQRPVPRPPSPRPAPPARPPAADTARRLATPADSVAADSVAADSAARAAAAVADTGAARELVKWAEPDSVMRALAERAGYSTTRYQGDEVIFRAGQRELVLRGNPAAVSRGAQIIVSDTVVYNDSLQLVTASGDTSIVRDPSQGDDIVSSGGQLVYDIANRRAIARNVRTVVESGERWVVNARTLVTRLGAPPGTDSTARAGGEDKAVYGYQGFVTSCQDPDPHYSFRANELKVVSKNILVARPAILYIKDVPVFYLPFVFQDLRGGRRSGLLVPRFGVAELLRNSPNYRRQVENVGYYVNLGDYADVSAWLDWRSGAGRDSRDPSSGFTRYNGELSYRWIDRFVTGRLSAGYDVIGENRARNTRVSWDHVQNFSERTNLNIGINYVSSSTALRQTVTNPFQTLATISSRAALQTRRGPFSVGVSGTQTQQQGSDEIQRTFPTFSLTSKSIQLADWLAWTPSLTINVSDRLRQRAPGDPLAFRFSVRDGVLDSARVDRNSRDMSLAVSSPLQVFDLDVPLAVDYRETVNDFPTAFAITRDTVIDGRRESVSETRVFARAYRQELNWNPSLSLPGISRGRLNVTPSVSLTNVDASSPLLVRTNFSQGRWVAQAKRPTFALGVSPTLFAFLPGFGLAQRLRHSVSPSLSYSYAPRADVSDDFLRAVNRDRASFLGALPQSAVTLGFNQTLEAKLRPAAGDTSEGAGRKIRVLSLNLSPVSYDFIRADTAGSGFTTTTFNYSVASDLLPGFNLSSSYSLFEGDPQSDTANFKPYRTGVQASFSINRQSGIFAALTRLFGRVAPAGTAPTPQGGPDRPQPVGDDQDRFRRQLASQSMAGSGAGNAQFAGPQTGQGWQASISLSSTRQRPVRGLVQLDLASLCGRSSGLVDPVEIASCLANPQRYLSQRNLLPSGATIDTARAIAFGQQQFRVQPLTTVTAQTSFNITPSWAASWSTGYDLETKRFADHMVTLQRELHDWRTVFGFTQSVTGAFAFNFFIALKAQPDIKFNYDRRSFPRATR